MNDKTNKMLGTFLSSYVSRLSEDLVYDKLFQTRTARLLQGLREGEKLAVEAGINILSAAVVSNIQGNSILSTVAQSLLVDAGPEITRRMRMNEIRPEDVVEENLHSNPSTVVAAFDEAFSNSPPVLTAGEYEQILNQHGYTTDSWHTRPNSGDATRVPNGPATSASEGERKGNGGTYKSRWFRDGLVQSGQRLRSRREQRHIARTERLFKNRIIRAIRFLKTFGTS